MAELSHRQVMSRINALLDEALDEADADEVRRHLFACPTCSAEVETWARLRAAVKHAYAPAAVPSDLASRVHAELQRQGEA